MVSTPIWTVALFQRVLANLPPREVAAASSRVLEEEFSSVHRLVDDVVASFAKLAEVRDAVSKLEQGRASTGGRSASLMATMESVMSFQEENWTGK
ncbi:hypothetical protein PRNP1_011451 [Phytophthora ramorum]